MKNCPVCGKPMEDAELFCGSCGAKYEEPVQASGTAETGAAGGSFCPNCGTQVETGTVFCPNCGANVTTGAPAAASKPKLAIPKLVGFAVAGVAAVAVLVLVINLLMGAFATPANKFVSLQEGLLKELVTDNLSAAGNTYNKTNSFSTDLTLTASTKNTALRRLLEDSALTLKVDATDKTLMLNGGITFMGDELADATLTYEKDKLGICIPEADPNYYVIGTKAIYELMGIDEEDLKTASSLKKPTFPTDRLNKLIGAYWKILTTAVTEDNTTKSDKEQFKLTELDKKLDGELYVFKPGADDVEEMLLKLADRLEEDKELRNIVKDFVNENRDFMEAALEGSGYDLDDLEAELDEALVDLADELRDEAGNIGRAVKQAGFKWSVGVSEGKICLEKLEFNGVELVYESTGEETVLYGAENGQKEFLFRLERKEKDGLLRGSISYTDYSYSYYSDSYYENTATLTFKNVDRKKTSILGIPYGTYSVDMDGEELKLDVEKGEKGGTDHTLTLPEIYVNYELGYVDGVKFTLNTSDKKSTATKPSGKTVDISDYDMEELQELVTDIGNELGSIFGDVSRQISGTVNPAETPSTNPGYDW